LMGHKTIQMTMRYAHYVSRRALPPFFPSLEQ
jgi:hypothetical protein